MIKTLEDIIRTFGNKLDTYAIDEAQEIEEYLGKNGVEIYNIKDDADNIDEHSISVADIKTFLRYLVNHSAKEIFKYEEVLEKQSFLLHFLEKIRKENRYAVKSKEDIKNACDLYSAYLNTVIADGICICSRIIYCIGTYPMITFSCNSDIEKLIEVENELIQEVTQSRVNLDEVVTHLNIAEEEIDSAFNFLVNDANFRKCSNAALRKDYKGRELMFQGGRFPNLHWIVSKYYTIVNCCGLMVIPEKEIFERVNNIRNRYEIIYDQAWKEIKNNR